MKSKLTLILLVCFLFNAYSQDTVSVVLNPSEKGLRIANDFAGLSFEISGINKWFYTPSKDTLANLLKTLGLQSFRIGANAVDRDTFVNSSLAQVTPFTRFNTASLDSFFGFIQKVNCKVILGVNLGGYFNPSLVSQEVSYIMKNYSSCIWGLELGNEPDFYYRKYRDSSYNVHSYEKEFSIYCDSIRRYYPNTRFVGPACAAGWQKFTKPFCRNMHGKVSMLTHHYYVAAANSAPINKQVNALMNPERLKSLVKDVKAAVQCADSAGIPFRLDEFNSFWNGGQWGVSNAFASSIWVLDFMYTLANTGCAGVNLHTANVSFLGPLGGPYAAIAYDKNAYAARPVYYGILAFQVGSKGQFITTNVTNKSNLNLKAYGVIDSLNTIFVTVINKDTLKSAFLDLNTGSKYYKVAEYISLSAPSVYATSNITLGGNALNGKGTISEYKWNKVAVRKQNLFVSIPASSAIILRLKKK
jgi:hypothetical protein